MNSLRTQMMFWGFVIVLVPGILFLVLFYNFAINELYKEKINLLKIATETQQELIENWFDEKQADIKAIAALRSVKQQDDYWMDNNFREIIKEKNLADLVFVNARGFTEVDTSAAPGLYLYDREYFQEGLKGHAYTSDILVGRANGRSLIIISAPVYDYNGKFAGVVFGTVKLDTVIAIANKFSHAQSVHTYLIDRNGEVLGANRAVDSKPNSDFLKDVFNDVIGTNSVGVVDQQHKVLSVYRIIPDRNWAIVGEIDKNEIFGPLYKTLSVMFAIFCLILLLSLFTALILSRHISRPVEQLKVAAERMRQGDYSYELKHDYQEGPQEIQLYIDAFIRLRDTIYEKEELWQRYRLLSENTQDIVLFIRAKDGKILEANAAGIMAYGYSMEELLNKTIQDLRIHNDSSVIREQMQQAEKDGIRFETVHQRKDGSIFPVEVSSRGAIIKGETVLMSLIHDITKRKQYEDQLTKLSLYDRLTGLYNRNYFEEEIKQLKIASIGDFAIIIVDLDGLKIINDRLGHQAGDALLMAVAEALKTNIRSVDVAARIGGDEFAVIVKEDAGKELIERIVSGIRQYCRRHSADKPQLPLYLSVGFAVAVNNEAVENVFRRADNAMYEEKNANRPTVRKAIKEAIQSS